MIKKTKIFFLAAMLVFICSTAIGGYDKNPDAPKAKPKDDIYKQVELFADAISIIRSDYVDEVESKKMIYGAMKGMCESLDDFSQFMEPEDFEDIKLETKGEFGGIGIEISLKDGIISVITPIVGTPAEAAGLKPGDKIVKINDKITKNMKLSDGVKEMRGKPGTTVKLTVWREKEQKILEFTIKRDIIKINSIKKAELVDGKIGYIRLIEFQANTVKDFDDALKKLESQGMDAFILDLRNNPGGILDGAVDIAERFLSKDKVIISIKARNPEQSAVFKSSGRFTRPDYPMVILVNEGSASASEIVSGALQDNKRAIILGAKTFGKASVQTVVPMKDGSALKITSASYITPSGRMIRDHGIIPDVAVERDEAESKKKEDAGEIFEMLENKDKKEDGKEIKETKEESKIDLKKDNQLSMAVNLLKAMKVYNEK